MIVLDLENVRFTLENDNVQTTIKKKIPSYLYKYYSLSNENGYQSLRNNTLFFAHPNHLNDLMDGGPFLWDLDRYKEELEKENGSNINEEDDRVKFYTCFTKNRGVLSLSSNPTNSLMWPHYTQEQGFCIEFNTGKVLAHFDNLESNAIKNIYFFPISYQANFKQIDFNHFVHDSNLAQKLLEMRNYLYYIPIL